MATREILWNVSFTAEIGFYVLATIAVGVLAYGVWRQIRRVCLGQPVAWPRGEMSKRLGRTLAVLASQRTIFKGHLLAGWMHAFIMGAMVVLLVATAIVAVEYDVFHKLLGLDHVILKGAFFLGFELVTDLFGLVLIAGAALALTRRYILRRPQLKHQMIDWTFPLWLIAVALTGFAVEGLRLAATAGDLGYLPGWSPVGNLFAQMFAAGGAETLRMGHAVVWWFHALLALTGIALIPYIPKVTHLAAAGINVFFEDLRPRGRLAPLDVEGAFERDEVLGYEHLTDLSRKDWLDVISCTECGRCEQNCPAAISGKILSPRDIVLGLRQQSQTEYPLVGQGADKKRILEARIPAEALWCCTTCMACVESCPVYIDPLAKVLELRRNEVMLQDAYPETFETVFSGVEKRGNPWNEHPTMRLEWAKGLDVPIMAEIAQTGKPVEYLFWVGCAAASDPRSAKIARSMVRILAAAQVSFAVLGEEERCTGDPARRMGHEYLFGLQAQANIEILQKYAFKQILTICPHCFNTFSKDYPDFGGHYPVIHHTQLIGELLAQGRIALDHPISAKAVFHDPCYLGRHNRIFDAPRDVLGQIPGLETMEMAANHEMAMCCGGGGGLTWIEEEADKRVNDRRVAQAEDALQGADEKTPTLIASACPFCMLMMEDALAARDTRLTDKDIAELVAEAMGLER